jgi:KUP system potassium uptake protein
MSSTDPERPHPDPSPHAEAVGAPAAASSPSVSTGLEGATTAAPELDTRGLPAVAADGAAAGGGPSEAAPSSPPAGAASLRESPAGATPLRESPAGATPLAEPPSGAAPLPRPFAGTLPPAVPTPAPVAGHAPHAGFAALALGALGVVFGDIGTSPLYTLKECLAAVREHTGAAPTPADVLGLLSLLVWSLTLVVTVKYLAVIMRADSHGEGGIFALLSLVPARFRPTSAAAIGWVPLLVIVGAALLYGDGVITPAISVLSAVEGLGLVRPALAPWSVAITCAILVGLFGLQQRGTATIGKLFGPVMALWFIVLASSGLVQIVDRPSVLAALSPTYAVSYLGHHGLRGLGILGSVVLAVTGGEALYADMGHFGRGPIRTVWLAVVMPSLLLCYFGQGALVLAHPEAASDPFFRLAPTSLLLPLVLLSSLATVIASQALISGAFSLTRQAIQLGYLPRLDIRHTAADTEGQIYLPQINWLLLVGCLLVVVSFGSSSRLAAAYGLAVTGTMGVTSLVFAVVARHTWGWSRLRVGLVVGLFLLFDIPFFLTNVVKFVDGGFVPILLGALLVGVMLIWRRGKRLLDAKLAARMPSVGVTLSSLPGQLLARLPGTAVILSPHPSVTPPLLVSEVRRTRVLAERVVLLTVLTEHAPTVTDASRAELEVLEQGFYRMRLHFGFMESPDVPAALGRALQRFSLPFTESEVLYYLRRERVLAGPGGDMGPLAEGLFAALHRNATAADLYFRLPPERVVELGSQVDL